MSTIDETNPDFQAKEESKVEKPNESNRIDIIVKSKIAFKYLKDTSYDLFNEIFSDMEFHNLKKENIKINNYEDFYRFQVELNSNYKPIIEDFDYTKKANTKIIKEMPYKATKLRKLYEDDAAIIISPNGNFVRTLNIENTDDSTLSHYKTVIGNSLIRKGVYYFEIKILELGENKDLCLGIISRNCDLIKEKKYRQYPLNEFDNCYGINLNNIDSRTNFKISMGSVFSIKVDLKNRKLCIFFEGKKFRENAIAIKDTTLGYYPAFSLSSGKEIQVKFGGTYTLDYYFEKPEQFDKRPICQYNNLEKIVSCYMEIIENNIIKIINHNQISYVDSIRFFYPMISFFANIAFNDEYIMKEYILKYMYKNYYKNKDIDELFDERYNFIYLIINNIKKGKRTKSILFLLDCLCEDIKNCSYMNINKDSNEKRSLLIRLYNYFLNKNIFKEILFQEKENHNTICKRIKVQLLYIFQSIRLFGMDVNDYMYSSSAIDQAYELLRKFINNDTQVDAYSKLIETLIGIDSKNELYTMNQIDDLIYQVRLKTRKERKDENEKVEQINIIKEEKLDNYQILEKYVLNKNKDKEEINLDDEDLPPNLKSRKLENNPYRTSFLLLIKEMYDRKSDFDYYNFISTIFISLINSFYNHYEKENSSNYSNKQILSFLPLLWNDNNFLSNSNSDLFISDDFLNEGDKSKSLKNIIENKLLNNELYTKKYNISSYILKYILILSSFFEKELFNFDLYLENGKHQNKIKRLQEKYEYSKINTFIDNVEKLILFYNKFSIDYIKRAIDIFIPYFTELLNNNLYLLLPNNVINLFKLLIKFLFYCFFIYEDNKIFFYENTPKLIKLFVSYNFKVLNDSNANKSLYFEILDNIIFLYHSFELIKDRDGFICSDSDNNSSNLNLYELVDFDYYIEGEKLLVIIQSIEHFFNNLDKTAQKCLTDFILYLCPSNSSENNNFISIILDRIAICENDFWFNNFIIEHSIKKKLIKKIIKIGNLLDEFKENTIIEENVKKKYKKYIDSTIKYLNYISYFIEEENVLVKYFGKYTKDSIFDIISENSKNKKEEKNNIKNDKKYFIYSYFILVATLIMKNLFNKNFFKVFFGGENHLNREEYNINLLIEKCISFLFSVCNDIPKNYLDIVENNNKKKNKHKKNEKIELPEELRNYYENIINNIKINDIVKLTNLFGGQVIRVSFETYQSKLRQIIKIINEIENSYNIFPKESNEKNESQDSNICPICLDNQCNIHLIHCNHMFCYNCILKLENLRCPVCREGIRGVKEHPEFFEQRQKNNNNNLSNRAFFPSPF